MISLVNYANGDEIRMVKLNLSKLEIKQIIAFLGTLEDVQQNSHRLQRGGESSLREGFFSPRSNLTTIATSMRIKIASCLEMTTFL